jgi:hypothetical protein
MEYLSALSPAMFVCDYHTTAGKSRDSPAEEFPGESPRTTVHYVVVEQEQMRLGAPRGYALL